MLRYVGFELDWGRMGRLQGRFVLDQEQYDKLQAAVGTEIHYGEALGKHSEVSDVLAADDLEVITEDQAFLLKAQELGIDLDFGYNPLNYLEDEVFEDEEE